MWQVFLFFYFFIFPPFSKWFDLFVGKLRPRLRETLLYCGVVWYGGMEGRKERFIHYLPVETCDASKG